MRNRYIVLVAGLLAMVCTAQVMAFDLGNNESSIPTASTKPKESEPSLMDKVAKLEKGKTTYNEVIALLGDPERVSMFPQDKRIQYSKFSLIGKSFAAVLIFNKTTNILENVETYQY